jgi:endonuclease YncB( thermonuclease family)
MAMIALGRLAIWTAAVLCAVPAAGQSAMTTAVIDGATLDYKGVAVHLWGIDAPEKAQVCADGWPAGLAAIDHLKGLIQGHQVACVQKSADQSPRVTAVCKAGDKDLSAQMASAGLAWALTSETLDYTVPETNAMASVLGVHGHPCMKVWEWRNKQLKLPP